MSSIVALPGSVMIDVDEGELTGPVMIHYKAQFFSEPIIWQRIVGEDWERIENLADRLMLIPTGNPDDEGVFIRHLRPGDIYEVLLHHDENADPNVAVDDPSPDARATAMGLRKGPEATGLVVNEEFGPNGTSFEWHLETAETTFACLDVSANPPITDIEGVQFFPEVVDTVSSGLSTSHDLEVASPALLPGNPFHALLRVVDQDGNWQIRHEQFETKRRRVTVQLRELHIVNDGAPGNNTASFRIWVLQGTKLRAQCVLPEREISDSPSPGSESQEFIQLGPNCPPPVVLGPEVVTDDNNLVSILTRGVASVTVGSDNVSGNFLPTAPSARAEPDDFSGYMFGRGFNFPIGRAREKVENRRFVVRANPLTDHEFVYDVEARISVDYHT
jgi:hypothetical protein